MKDLEFSLEEKAQCFGLVLDHNRNIWVACDGTLQVIDQEFRQIKLFTFNTENMFNRITRPPRFMSQLRHNQNKTALFWLKSNVELVYINMKTMKINSIFSTFLEMRKSKSRLLF